MAEKDRYIGVSMGLDIQALQAGLKQASSEIALANSEFKKQTAGLDQWAKSAQGVAEKVVAVATEVTQNEQIVENYRRQLQLVADAFGEDSTKAKELQKALNNAESDLRKSQSNYDSLTAKLEELSDADTLATQGASNLQTAIGRLTEHVDEQRTAIDKTRSKLDDAKQTYGETSPEVEALTRKLDLQEGQLDILETTLGTYKTALDKCDTETGELNSSTGSLASGLRGVDSAASSLSDAGLEKLKVKMENLRDRVFSQMLNKAKELATATVNLGIDFTGTMAEVQAISGASKDELDSLTATAREFGSTTVFSATESAQALKYMALAGWSTEQSTSALGGVLDLAASSGMDLAKASDMVTDYITAFGLEAKDAGGFADMLAYAQSHANTTAEGLGEAYKNSAAVMAASGQTVTTTTALLSKMADAGLKGSTAGTALSAMMRDITKKMKDGAIQIGETTVTVADQEGSFRSLTDILIDVESAVGGMGTAERATALQTTFTADSIKGLNLVLGQGTQNVKAFEGELSRSDGTAKRMADTMNDNLGGDIKKLKSAFEELQLKLFDLLEGPLRGIVDFITNNLPLVITLVGGVATAFAGWKVASVLKDMVTGIQAVIPVLTALTSGTALATAAEVAHTAATTAMTVAQGVAATATTALSAAFTFLAANPIVLVIAAIAAIGIALYELYQNCEWFRDAIDGLWDAICGFFTWAAEEIMKAWDGVVRFFEGVWNGIKGAFSGVGTFFDNAGKNAKKFFEDPWQGTVDFFGDVKRGIERKFDTFCSFFGVTGDDARKAFTAGWETITSFFGNVWNGIKSTFSGVGSWFGSVFDGAVNGIKNAFNGIKTFFEGIWNSIAGFFEPVLAMFGIKASTKIDPKLKEYESEVERLTRQVEETANRRNTAYDTWVQARSDYGYYSNTTTRAQEAYSTAYSEYNKAQNALNKAKADLDAYKQSQASSSGGVMGDVTKSIRDSLTNGLSGVADIITKPFKSAFDGITGIFSGIGDWFNKNVVKPISDAIGGITNAVKDITGGVSEGISKGASNVTSGIQKFGEDVYNGICDFFGIHSPSTLMRDKVGKMIAEGIGEGISAGELDVLKSIRDLGTDASRALDIHGATSLGTSTGTIIYNQTINSPEPLTAGQIYRDTKSLIGRRLSA